MDVWATSRLKRIRANVITASDGGIEVDFSHAAWRQDWLMGSSLRCKQSLEIGKGRFFVFKRNRLAKALGSLLTNAEST